MTLADALTLTVKLLNEQGLHTLRIRESLNEVQQFALSLAKRQESVDAFVGSVNELVTTYETRFKVISSNQNELNGKLAMIEQLLRIEGYGDDIHRNYN
jgi:ABC-type transporter Mla subunit MlaD